jgi:hypothetical protein
MSVSLTSRRVAVAQKSRWASAAFLVEAMLLLVLVMCSLAVLVQLFSASLVQAREADDLADAVALASNAAERFSADPAGLEPRISESGLTALCDVEAVPHESGILYRATIRVYRAGEDPSAPGRQAGPADGSADNLTNIDRGPSGNGGIPPEGGPSEDRASSSGNAPEAAYASDGSLFSIETAVFKSGVVEHGRP